MIIKNIGVLSVIILLSFSSMGWIDLGIEHRIEKRVHKLFHGNAIELEPLLKLPSGFQDAGGEIYAQYAVSDGDKLLGFVIHGMTHVCYFGGCSVYTDQSKNVNREEVEYLIYFNEESEIKFIEIIDFESNYGYEISAKWWLKQFYNKKPGSFKIGEDIDGITGATVSCEQFVNTVNELLVSE